MNEELLRKLEQRLGPLHARQRLGIETDHEAQVFGHPSCDASGVPSRGVRGAASAQNTPGPPESSRLSDVFLQFAQREMTAARL
jgi:hypothetical protein